MSHKRLWIAGAIIGFIIIGSFVFFVPRARDGGEVSKTQGAVETVPTVSLRDVFKKGTHTITGSVTVPDACQQVTAQATVLDGPETKSIQVAVTITSEDGVCLQVPTPIKFSTTITAPAGLPLKATVNGKQATTTML